MLQTDEVPPLAELLSSKSHDPRLLSTPQASSYLTHLTSLSLPLLLTEPQTLANETGALTSQLTQLCTAEYTTFLSLQSTSSTLSECLDSFSSSLESLLASIPTLESETHSFAASTKSIQSQRTKAGLVLEQHDKLLDVLQIPQLIDTCVRNGYYAEAMDLSSHTASLLARFSTVPIIIDVAAEAEQAIRLMFSQLLALLREPAKLPALFKAVNFLRRMETLDEEELALAFLTSRTTYLEGLFGGIERQRTDQTRYLRRYVDIFREGVYDMVTQFTTIFLDRTSADTELHATLLHFLQTYTHTHISQLMALLRSTVPQIEDPPSLTSLLTQLTYCATSFSRIGLDFRSLLQQPFSDAVLNAMKTSVSNATEDFVAQMDKNANMPFATWFITPSLLASLPQQHPPELNDKVPIHIAPAILSSYPLLATYTNSILTALNSLRLLAPVCLLPQLSVLLEKSLATIGEELISRAKEGKAEGQGQSQGKEGEDLALDAAGAVYARCLVPFVWRALKEGVYGAKVHGSTGMRPALHVVKDWEDRLSSLDQGCAVETRETIDE